MWNRLNTDFVVIGSGIAGLTLSLLAAEHGRVSLITKGELGDGNSRLAQGGIAAVLGADDEPHLHKTDTLRTGQGLCVDEVVQVIVEQAPAMIQFLQDIGVQFDHNDTGQLQLGREGAHSRNRIVHSGGDQTGKATMDVLLACVHAHKNIQIYERTYACELVVENGECTGLLAVDASNAQMWFCANSVVLATGGLGQLYKYTTNDVNATGDGYALAYRAGAKLRDMEFVQFHPTGLKSETNPVPLVSEAVRGEGARLVNAQQVPFMAKYHPWADLAGRDVVAKAVYQEMSLGRDVYLDARMIEKFEQRFPTIYQFCRARGINPSTDCIPIVPVAHYTMGGILTDVAGQTSILRLFAIGEVASSGLHGANRLASNSLLEGLVMAKKAVERMVQLPRLQGRQTDRAAGQIAPHTWDRSASLSLRQRVQDLMWTHVGITRNQEQLALAEETLSAWLKKAAVQPGPDVNLLTTALLVVRAALWRQESRGAHYRTDFPDVSPAFETHFIQEGTHESVSNTPILAASTS
ncbi:L-aspartate oxidase [Alicyclobacillus fodiniaquatilis]|uniref:L-aspartate oxidase n=1 Tax=Alicyclobacillus fodiniaquatilis TaxID=1661150 RepID=A0ABW4JDJ1_9BACL